MPPNTPEQTATALDFAAVKHAGQVRKGGRVPYLSHPVTVAAMAALCTGSPCQIAAALLHDTVEDCGGLPVLDEIYTAFGSDVAKLVEECTVLPREEEDWRQEKQRYLEHLAGLSEEALPIAACDKLHNALSIRSDYRRYRERVWSRFRGGRAGALWYYRSLADLFATRSDLPAARELVRVVADVEDTAAHASATATQQEPRPKERGAEPDESGWRMATNAVKDTVVNNVCRLASAGNREAAIVMAHLHGRGEVFRPAPDIARQWLVRVDAEELWEEILLV